MPTMRFIQSPSSVLLVHQSLPVLHVPIMDLQVLTFHVQLVQEA